MRDSVIMEARDFSSSINNRDRVARPTSQYPAPRTATPVAGNRAWQDGLTSSTSPLSSSGCRISKTLHCPSTSPRHQVQNNSGRHLHAQNRQWDQVIVHPQRRPNVQALPRSPLRQSDLDKLSLAPAVETTYTFLPPSPLTNNNTAAVSPMREHHGSEDALLGLRCDPRQPIRSYQPSLIVENDVISPAEAQQATLTTSDASFFRHNDPQYLNQAASGLQFVAFGERDLGKRPKRTDRIDDRRRKIAISNLHGACFGCKASRKQCDGQEVCNRCHRLGTACLRTCSRCRTKHLTCDDVAACQNCQISGAECIRPSVRNITTARPHQPHSLPTVSPCLPAEPPKSSTQLKTHTMETKSNFDAPAAWRFGFGVKPDLKQEHKRRLSQSLQIGPPRPSRIGHKAPADLQSDESARDVNSHSARVGSRRYSRQTTDVGLHPSFTQGSTAVTSEKDSLKAPDRQDLEGESCSGATETSYFDDAWPDEYGS